MPLSYSAPGAHAPTAPSTQNVVYIKNQMDNVRMQPAQSPPLPSQMLIIQRKPQIPSAPYYQAVPRRHPSMVSLFGSAYQPQQVPGAPMMSVSRQPVFYERKKASFKGPMLSRMQTNKPSHPHHYYRNQPTKLIKVEIKQQPRAKIELKNIQSEALPSENKSTLLKSMLLKPARNTGFDPKSIVIEKGFKPIIRKEVIDIENNTNLEKNSEMLQDEAHEDNTPVRYNEHLEPVFIPSPPDRNGIKKQSKKKLQLTRTKLKLDAVDDMEMAAANKERLDYVHLHLPILTPATNTNKRSPKSSSLILLSENSNSYNISEIKRSDAQNSNDTSKNSEHSPHASVERVKRNSQKEMSESRVMSYHRDHDSNAHQQGHDHSDHSHHDHGSHDHESHNPNHNESESSQQSSTGEIIMANIEYIFLTIVLYYVL